MIDIGITLLLFYPPILADKEREDKPMKKSEFYIFTQELWETFGHSTQLDERFVEELYERLFNATRTREIAEIEKLLDNCSIDSSADYYDKINSIAKSIYNLTLSWR